MTSRDLRTLLDAVPDTLEIVLRNPPTRAGFSPVREAWADARLQTRQALATWRTATSARGRAEAYATFRAAQDREDAAQAALHA